MRVKSQWFRDEKQKTPQEVGGAAAFIIWRIGQNALKNMRQAGFDIPVGPQYFGFLSELLIFLIQIADRIAYRHLDNEQRVEFTTALAIRCAEHLADSQGDLLGGTYSDISTEFIQRLNHHAADYADFSYDKDASNFSFYRYLGAVLETVFDEHDKHWVSDQIIDIEAPQAVATLERAMTGLLALEPKRASRRRSSGD